MQSSFKPRGKKKIQGQREKRKYKQIIISDFSFHDEHEGKNKRKKFLFLDFSCLSFQLVLKILLIYVFSWVKRQDGKKYISFYSFLFLWLSISKYKMKPYNVFLHIFMCTRYTVFFPPAKPYI